MDLSSSTFGNYSSFFSVISGDIGGGGEALTSSRLLGRSELVDTPHADVVSYLKTAMAYQEGCSGSLVTIGLSGGPGVRDTPQSRYGALHTSWRSAYWHFIATGAIVDSISAGSPKQALQQAAAWYEEVEEPMWRKWALESAAYMNETNPYNSNFKKDFYGSNYEALQEVKQRYDPEDSLFVLAGVGSDGWNYDLQTGKLCRV
ncbi:hypothetical protein BU23DRAFT_469638 [Bimuria novae-zelandiae CBS 107.79]|uniref:Berberine/berberine-like domain-containing protein n=1 Tax=Bimuria novae-zelandiae CBS 107.79 TaxID=1447943 RepID=A0A6A5V487_9PLEO|nr:hypothetical protein BU23DRAFT_469638 [Bimuria novae-zelandiae CBS 107.79]